MNPSVMWGQVLGLAIPAVVLVGLTSAAPGAIALGVALLIWWLFLDGAHAKALGTIGLSDGKDGGPNRKSLEHQVAAQSLLLSSIAVGVGVLGTVDRGVRLSDSSEVAICICSMAILGFAIYSSSLVDWYYIKPRLDGIVRDPPCRSSRERVWGRVTNRWYRHRSIAELISVFAIIAAFVALAAALFAGGHAAFGVLVSIAGLGATLLGRLPQRAVSSLRDYGIDSSPYWIGDLLLSESQPSTYLLHVEIKGLVVRKWNDERAAWAGERSIGFEELAEIDYQALKFEGCRENCSMVNPTCEWRWTERGAEERRRRLIL